MGSASSKFRKYVQNGDEYAAMQVYQNSPELRRSLDPNLGYGEHHQHNTAMHYAAKHGMKHLLRIFLVDLFGNPNKRNSRNETTLHMICQLPLTASPSAQDRRLACAQLVLQWKGGFAPVPGGVERIDLKAQDINGNTALHNAAASGLKAVVELLVSHGAPLFLENTERLTPCDVGMKANFHDIALFLESRMVFADVPSELGNDPVCDLGNINSEFRTMGTIRNQSSQDVDEVYTGLRAQDLQEAKDQLVVETADMLHIPLFTAEALLRDNEWSREILLEKWMNDPVHCCEMLGLQTPLSALRLRNNDNINCHPAPESQASLEYLEAPPTSPCRSGVVGDADDSATRDTCGICLEAIEQRQAPVFIPCDHVFCRRCWTSYLTLKITEGESDHVTCPALGCSILVPVELIESLVSKETARKYLHFDLNSFVATNPTIKWCPKPGCGRAVRLPEIEQMQPQGINLPTIKPPPRTSHAVDCGNGHFFCWECLGEAHAPAGCEQWVQWQQKVAEVKPEELKSTCTETENAANCYWLVTNCKACPSCKSPIQKNEGCNHMKCSKCKYDFCWVCLDAWKKHSSATGGYFRCNRYEAMHKADEKQGSLINEASHRNKHLQELNRFIHYYTRYKNHDNSRLLEEPLLHSARRKMELLAASLPAARSPVLYDQEPLVNESGANRSAQNQAPACTRFIEEGIRELIKARRILCGSYVYGFYLEDNGYNKTIFEFMQNELESVTEKLSEMVARPYLRTPRSAIVTMTQKVRCKRHEFIRAVSKGLIPPETPPALRRVHRRRFPGLMGIDPVEDEQITEAITASLRDLDPNNPWIKDSQGRHTNLSAIYDWPDANSDEEDSDVNQALAVSLLGACSREGCGRPRARNPRTGKVHEFCSLRCSHFEPCTDQPAVATTDFAMDLVIALEMSRLQLIEDEMRKQRKREQRHDGGSRTNMSQSSPSDDLSEDAQLHLAIHLSLEEARKRPASIVEPQEEAGAGGTTSAADVNDLSIGYFLKSLAKHELSLKNFHCDSASQNLLGGDPKSSKILFAKNEDHGESEGRFEISDLHQNHHSGFFSSSLSEDQQMETVSDGAVSSLPFPKRSHSACDIRNGTTSVRSSSLELESHDCIHELVENLSQGPPTRTLFRLQSLGTEFGSDELGGCTSSEETPSAVLKEDDDDDILSIEVSLSRSEKAEKPRLIRQAKIVDGEDKEATKPHVELSCPVSASELRQRLPLALGSFTSEGTTTPADETETEPDDQGIPRSPTLYISGVAISRTPEPDVSHLLSQHQLHLQEVEQGEKKEEGNLGKQNREGRSTSLTAAAIRSGVSQMTELCRGLSRSAGRLNHHHHHRFHQHHHQIDKLGQSPQNGVVSAKKRRDLRRLTMPAVLCFSGLQGSGVSALPPPSPFPSPSPRVVSRSACEPQREKEVFHFPKSPTEGTLSTVLLVREGANTRDAFHEALFLPRSPRMSEQRRKRSKRLNHSFSSSSSNPAISNVKSSVGNSDHGATPAESGVVGRETCGSQESSVL